MRNEAAPPKRLAVARARRSARSLNPTEPSHKALQTLSWNVASNLTRVPTRFFGTPLGPLTPAISRGWRASEAHYGVGWGLSGPEPLWSQVIMYVVEGETRHRWLRFSMPRAVPSLGLVKRPRSSKPDLVTTLHWPITPTLVRPRSERPLLVVLPTKC